jgi:hypothetical protein
MASERALGEAADKRTDIWAFVVVLHELLTGQRAFGDRTGSDCMAAALTMERDWSAARQRIMTSFIMRYQQEMRSAEALVPPQTAAF